MKIFIFGLGYVAQHFAVQAKTLGWTISGTHRQTGEYSEPNVFEFSETRLLDSEGLAALEQADAVLISIPPSGEMIDPVHRYYSRILASSHNLKWLGYLSTVGVYGEHHCNWVTEETDVAPQSPRTQARVQAEINWLKMMSVPTHIFRLAGIYGPGKSALDRARAGAPIIHKPVHVFNRIHVEDIVQALIASIQHPTPRQIYNLSDDLPAPGDEVLGFAYEQLELDVPEAVPFSAVDVSPMAAEFYQNCKRVNADKIKKSLNLKWIYPTYREGLAALKE